MSGGKQTPRQKMIALMYLVLTALLALNVSKEILNSFVLINDSLEITNDNFEEKNESQYAAFRKQLGINEAKVRPFYDKAMVVKSAADSLVEHIDELKWELVKETDKRDPEVVDPVIKQYKEASEQNKLALRDTLNRMFSLREVESKDNYDMPTHIMIGGDAKVPTRVRGVLNI